MLGCSDRNSNYMVTFTGSVGRTSVLAASALRSLDRSPSRFEVFTDTHLTLRKLFSLMPSQICETVFTCPL